MNTIITEIEVPIEHPMEEVLGIEPGTTLMPQTERSTDMVQSEMYDKKDKEIEDQLQEVYDCAMEAFEDQSREVQLVEGKYKARNGEIAVAYLNTALTAARDKLNQKRHKDKVDIVRNKSGLTNTPSQRLIIADRNEILKSILRDDAESKDTTD